MNPITKALDEVTFTIPREILNVVFIERSAVWRDTPTNVKDQIRVNVINPRVLVDCNLVGGTEALIPLDGVTYDEVDGTAYDGTNYESTNQPYAMVYRIPKSMTDGRSITSVLNVTYGSARYGIGVAGGFGMGALNSGGQAQQLGAAVMDAQMRMPNISTARVQLIGENTVMIRGSVMLPGGLVLRCILENDETLSHIQLRSYRVFAKLVQLAVKAYIYNNYKIKLDEGQIRGGMMVGTFKDIVDGYADAEQMYQEHLTEKWAKVAFMNDGESMGRWLKILVGGSR